jgi:rhodanese-related sulfurtransferase
MNLFEKIFGAPVEMVDPHEANKRIGQKPKPFLLDVRQPEEFRSGHIPGARLIPLGELPNRMNELPKNQEIIVVCHSGNRSFSASRQLAGAGYKVLNLRGGMSHLTRSGLPVTKDK